jgi:hypothetical protein
MKAALRIWRWVRGRRGRTLALLWVAALPLIFVVRMQLKQVQQTAAVVNFLGNVSELARARRDTAETDWLLRLAQRPDAIASQRALLERRVHRLELTGGLVIAMYGALFAASWSWLEGRVTRAPRDS